MAGESLSEVPSDPAAWSLRSIGRALRNRNYRLFFAGQSVSLIGTWLTRVATSWLVYRLTGSALLLGIVGFAGQIPTFFRALPELRRLARPTCVRLGILPEIAEGLRSTSRLPVAPEE